MSEVKIHGLEELSRTLKALPEKVRKNILRRAVGSGAAEIRKQAKVNAPVRTGTLRRAAYIKYIREGSNTNQVTFITSFRKGKKEQKVGKRGLNRDAFYASWVEFGHKKRNGGMTRPVRMLTRAFTAKASAALDVITRRVREGIAKL